MPKKPTTKSGPSDQPPAETDPLDPELQHLHDESRRPLKAPPGGVPANLPRQFPGKGPKHFGQIHGKGRSFRHQGR